jgi:hypothetical protein
MIAEGDTAAVLDLLRLTMTDIDAALETMERRDTVLAPEPDQEPRRVSVWLRDGVPRKLLVSEPNESGQMTAESAYWFVNGELRAVLQPFAGYFLEGDRILLWTDESLEPITDVIPQDRMDRELALVAEVELRLAHFGLRLQ